MLRKKKIGILALQESHLTDELADQIGSLFAKRIQLLNSSDLNNPTASAGIAFVLNKELVDIKWTKISTLIPGRAALLTISWQHDEPIHIINIYAPSNLSDHPAFWKQLEERWRELNLPTPHFTVGDFNVTEDSIDRAPNHADQAAATNALRECRNALNVQDTWRMEHPNDRLFTYISANNTMSRLDRIYTQADLPQLLFYWTTETSQVPTDHKLVMV